MATIHPDPYLSVYTTHKMRLADTGHRLSVDDYDELLALLQNLTGSRVRIQEAMGFCLDNADAAEEVSGWVGLCVESDALGGGLYGANLPVSCVTSLSSRSSSKPLPSPPHTNTGGGHPVSEPPGPWRAPPAARRAPLPRLGRLTQQVMTYA